MLFYTDFVGEVLYEGVPSALPGSVPRQRYEEGQFLFISMVTNSVISHLSYRREIRETPPSCHLSLCFLFIVPLSPSRTCFDNRECRTLKTSTKDG